MSLEHLVVGREGKAQKMDRAYQKNTGGNLKEFLMIKVRKNRAISY